MVNLPFLSKAPNPVEEYQAEVEVDKETLIKAIKEARRSTLSKIGGVFKKLLAPAVSALSMLVPGMQGIGAAATGASAAGAAASSALPGAASAISGMAGIPTAVGGVTGSSLAGITSSIPEAQITPSRNFGITPMTQNLPQAPQTAQAVKPQGRNWGQIMTNLGLSTLTQQPNYYEDLINARKKTMLSELTSQTAIQSALAEIPKTQAETAYLNTQTNLYPQVKKSEIAKRYSDISTDNINALANQARTLAYQSQIGSSLQDKQDYLNIMDDLANMTPQDKIKLQSNQKVLAALVSKLQRYKAYNSEVGKIIDNLIGTNTTITP